MKITALFLVLGLTSIAQAAPKTCTATLGGTIRKKVVSMPDPHVFYPDSTESRPAKWMGNLNTVAFVPPPAVKVECGKPFLYANFDAPTATGTLPDAIVTLPWEKIGYDGKPKVVDPETLYGIGDSMEYPTPQATFVGTENLIIETLPKEGVSDICKVHKVMLPDSLTIKTKIDIDPVASRYFSTSLDGHYEWDSNKSPRGMEVDVELDDPYVNITCDATWDFKMTFEWPFDFEEGDFGTGQVCKGNVQRKMEISGEFTVIEDNKVTGYIEVQEPTVTSSGAVVGSYSGGGFSQAIDGFLYNDLSGESYVDLPFFDGGDAVTWKYSLNCWGGTVSRAVSGAVREYFKVINHGETPSVDHDGYFKLLSSGDDKTYTVNMGGQGIVTIHRTLKKK